MSSMPSMAKFIARNHPSRAASSRLKTHRRPIITASSSSSSSSHPFKHAFEEFGYDDDDDDDNNNNNFEKKEAGEVWMMMNGQSRHARNRTTSLHRRRRDVLLASTSAALVVASVFGSNETTNRAEAIESGFISDAWESFGGGGPSDLTFPESFQGEWLVNATLTDVDLPEGAEVVSNIESVNRAKKDVGRPTSYPLRFVRNSRNEVILDRAWNTEKLAEYTMNVKNGSVFTSIDWNLDDPNVMKCSLADGKTIYFKVTARSETEDDSRKRRFETSELAEVVFNDYEGSGTDPNVKRTRTYTKWLWRDEKDAQAGQPLIVCTQIVLDYLTPFSSGNGNADETFIRVAGKPVTVYTYKLAMFKTGPGYTVGSA
jgi:hypothetical protein